MGRSASAENRNAHEANGRLRFSGLSTRRADLKRRAIPKGIRFRDTPRSFNRPSQNRVTAASGIVDPNSTLGVGGTREPRPSRVGDNCAKRDARKRAVVKRLGSHALNCQAIGGHGHRFGAKPSDFPADYGRKIKALAQPTKTAFLFVLNRETSSRAGYTDAALQAGSLRWTTPMTLRQSTREAPSCLPGERD